MLKSPPFPRPPSVCKIKWWRTDQEQREFARSARFCRSRKFNVNLRILGWGLWSDCLTIWTELLLIYKGLGKCPGWSLNISLAPLMLYLGFKLPEIFVKLALVPAYAFKYRTQLKWSKNNFSNKLSDDISPMYFLVLHSPLISTDLVTELGIEFAK